MELVDLISSLKNSVNAPGEEFFVATDPEWREALASAFWWGRMRGYFVDYKVDADNEVIETIVEGGEDIPREVAQIIVAIAALNALEAKILALPTTDKVKAGPVEAETQRSASVLVALLAAKRKELEDLRSEVLSSSGAIYASVIDGVLARQGAFMCGEAAWVN